MIPKILFLEPFDQGSHASFRSTLQKYCTHVHWTWGLLPGRHWKWRMRGAALHFARQPHLWSSDHHLIFASSYLNLPDLIALQPKAQKIPSWIYFHENQWAYPSQYSRERDFHLPWIQVVSCLAAQKCLFNSYFNLSTFLDFTQKTLRALPDFKSLHWVEEIRQKSSVLYLPIDFPNLNKISDLPPQHPHRKLGPIILWNHRWEYDKNPEEFFKALWVLKEKNLPFRLIVCGQSFKTNPPVFDWARQIFDSNIVHWGFAKDRKTYVELLQQAHIAVSTANHEFFGISMLEAAYAGAFVLAPNRLAYPELFAPKHLYDHWHQLVSSLEKLIHLWISGQIQLRKQRQASLQHLDAKVQILKFRSLFSSLGS